MPELPEVETTCQGIKRALLNSHIQKLNVFETRLRWPVPAKLAERVHQQPITSIYRRAKYILMDLKSGSLIWHLGMSGSMRLCDQKAILKKHDHIEMILSSGVVLRYNDPRRFGCLLYEEGDPLAHRLLAKLGPEPLMDDFDGDYLYQNSRKRHVAVKSFIMNQNIVVGVGNIYASEALHAAGILPTRLAGRIARKRYQRLAQHIKKVLQKAIDQGGTTLRDFTKADGKPGYFSQQLQVYGRGHAPCFQCGQQIRQVKIEQRASYFCRSCQT